MPGRKHHVWSRLNLFQTLGLGNRRMPVGQSANAGGQIVNALFLSGNGLFLHPARPRTAPGLHSTPQTTRAYRPPLHSIFGASLAAGSSAIARATALARTRATSTSCKCLESAWEYAAHSFSATKVAWTPLRTRRLPRRASRSAESESGQSTGATTRRTGTP